MEIRVTSVGVRAMERAWVGVRGRLRCEGRVRFGVMMRGIWLVGMKRIASYRTHTGSVVTGVRVSDGNVDSPKPPRTQLPLHFRRKSVGSSIQS